MAKPLLLPGFAKRAARAVRDTPATNNFITSGLRPIVKHFPADAKAALAAHFPRVGTVTTRLPGGQRMRLASSEPEGVLNSIFYGSWVGAEPEVLPLWHALCQDASVIVDIGAHIGHFTLVGGLANPSARVFSFEPLPRIAALLKQNVELNRMANVTVQAKALGREAGTLPFYAVPNGLPSSSSLSKEFMSDGFGEIVEIPVEVSTLDFEHIPTDGPVVVKIDTETTEPDVIAGGPNFLSAAMPVIIVEILESNDTAARLTEELSRSGYGFQPFLLTDAGPVKHDSLAADSRWRNHLLVPREGPGVLAFRDTLAAFGAN